MGAEQFEGAEVVFSGEQARQMASVLRLRAGERVRVFVGNGEGDRVVELGQVTSRAARGCIVGCLAPAAEPRVRLVAYPALLARDKFDQVLQKLVEVGVARVVPVRTARSLVRELPDRERQARWQRIVREAAEQCGRAVVPELSPPCELPAALAQAVAVGPALVADAASQHAPLRVALAELVPAPRVVSIFVGPEGGFTEGEVEAARAQGARLVSLGPRVLRTETASPVLAALVVYELDKEET